ncbi:MAG: polysaccharide deacetylase family protein [Hyphomicrobium sp.]|jgi:peptidoglycan/xylan/chitin deacetylase (PgdA/CDA1 family)
MRLSLTSLLISAAVATVAAAGQVGQPNDAAPNTVAKAKLANTNPPQATSTEKQPAAAPAPKPAIAGCENPNALGVSRTVEIDTTGGPGFGFEHYKAYDFLADKEVVLTFDDGPQVGTTKAVLDALAKHCTKALFFSIGKMAIGLPEIIRDVAARGHTIGTHTWSHQDIRKKGDAEAKDELERGISGVRRGVGGPIAPFFRFPYLKDSPSALTHLASRNIAVFSTDIDSFDFKPQTSENLVKSIMAKLEKKGKGILLMHDIQKHTAQALPALLDAMKEKGYKIVQVKPKEEVKTLAEYDTLIEKDVKGLPAAGAERPVSSIIRTVPTTP